MTAHLYALALGFLCYPSLAARIQRRTSSHAKNFDSEADSEETWQNHLNQLLVRDGHKNGPAKYITKSQRIVVIGAGPAGVHIARELQKRGFGNVTILELTDRVGGKSYTRYLDGHDKPCNQRYEENGRVMFNKSCIPLEYGTCFLHNGYHRVRELIHEYNIRREARSVSVISASNGFDTERFIDAEKEDILKAFGIHKHHIEVLLKAVATDAEEHIEAAFQKVLEGQFIPDNAVNDIGKKTSELITKAVNHTMGAFARETTKLAAGLEDEGLKVYNAMNKANYASYGSGDYTMHVTEHVLADEALRGRPAGETDVHVHFKNCVHKYAQLRRQVFAEPKFRMPGRLNDVQMKEMAKTFRAWMVDHELQALIPFFQVAHAAQGYGYLWEVPAYYGLSWMSPDLVYGVLHSGLRGALAAYKMDHRIIRKGLLAAHGIDSKYAKVKEITTMVPEGYASIWREMHLAMKRDCGGKDPVHFNIKDLSIDRQLHDENAPVKVHWEGDGGVTHDEEFDFLMYTGPLKFMERYVGDVQAQERLIFSSLTAYTYAVTLYRTNSQKFPVQGYTNDNLVDGEETEKVELPGVGHINGMVLYNADNEVDGPRSDYKWFVDRNDPELYAVRGEIAKNYPPQNQRRMAGQFVGHESSREVPTSDEERPSWFGTGATDTGGMRSAGLADLKAYMLKELKADMKRRGVEDIQVLEQMPWPYFWHFNNEDIAKGRPWDLLEMQGSHKTWYLGASSSFESINDIVNYNLMLLDRSVFSGFRLKHNSEYATEHDWDAFFDTAAICCCDGHREDQCTLVPKLYQWAGPLGHPRCPKVKASHWPMSHEKEAEMKIKSRNDVDYLKLHTPRSSDACKDLESVVILTADAY